MAPTRCDVLILLSAAVLGGACSPATAQPVDADLGDADLDQIESENDEDPFERGADTGTSTVDARPPDIDAAPVETPPLDRVRAAAAELIEDGDPELWGRAGRLSTTELSNPFVTTGIEGIEAFNVLDSEGYEGDYKCNLLVFELAFRAGLVVPLMGRGRGWGYPGPAVVIDQIESGRLLEHWASVVEPTDLEHVQSLTERGFVLMIVGSRLPSAPGHVGMVESVHTIEHDTTERISFVEYTGWEAIEERAVHERRRWRIGQYTAIYLLELRVPGPGEPQVLHFGFGPIRSSLADAVRHTPESLTIGRSDDLAQPSRARGLPILPVAHSLLGQRSSWGPVLDVSELARYPAQGDSNEAEESGALPDEPLQERLRALGIGRIPDAGRAETDIVPGERGRIAQDVLRRLQEQAESP